MPAGRNVLLFLSVVAACIGVASAAAADGWVSSRGLYRIAVNPSLDPIPINRIHRWMLEVETAAGAPAQGAKISVTGGMPEHDHGLPTAPRVTREPSEGRYQLEGVRFHMNGYWEMTITISGPAGRDTVVIPVQVR